MPTPNARALCNANLVACSNVPHVDGSLDDALSPVSGLIGILLDFSVPGFGDRSQATQFGRACSSRGTLLRTRSSDSRVACGSSLVALAVTRALRRGRAS